LRSGSKAKRPRAASRATAQRLYPPCRGFRSLPAAVPPPEPSRSRAPTQGLGTPVRLLKRSESDAARDQTPRLISRLAGAEVPPPARPPAMPARQHAAELRVREGEMGLLRAPRQPDPDPGVGAMPAAGTVMPSVGLAMTLVGTVMPSVGTVKP